MAATTQVRLLVWTWFGTCVHVLRTERQAVAVAYCRCRQGPAAATMRAHPPPLTAAFAAVTCACVRSAATAKLSVVRMTCRPQAPRFGGLAHQPLRHVNQGALSVVAVGPKR